MSPLTSLAALAAQPRPLAEGGSSVGAPPYVFGIVAYAVFLILLLITFSLRRYR